MAEPATTLPKGGVVQTDLHSQLKAYLDRQSGITDEPAPKAEEDVKDEAEEILDEEEDSGVEEGDESSLEDDNESEFTDEEEADEEESDADFLQRKIHVTSDGEDLEITVEEASKGYLRNQDYTKKTQALADLRKHTVQFAEQLKQGIQLVDQFMSAELAPYEQLDWEALKAEDESKYLMAREEYRSAQQRVQGLRQSYADVTRQQTQHQMELMKGKINEEAQLLAEYKPEIKAEKTRGQVTDAWKAYSKTIGFSEDEFQRLMDHRIFKLLDKAMQFDELQKKGQSIREKKVRKAGKQVQKGAQRDRATSTSQKIEQDLMKNFSTKKNVDSAAALLKYRMEKVL